jgi:phosphohistidine phosphatase
MSPHARRIFLVRHAKAEPHTGGDDDARRLTSEGRARFTALVHRLRGRLQVARVLTSPLIRARETGEILAHATGAPLEEAPRLAAGRSSAQDLMAMVRRAPAGTALVGHNPEIAEALARLDEPGVDVKPGGIAALDVEGEEVRMAWIEVPAKG